MIYRALQFVLWLLKMVLIVYIALSWLRPSANRFTVAVTRIIEPLLAPIRRFLDEKLPRSVQVLDWSPAVLWLLIVIAGRMLTSLYGILH